MKSKKKAKSPEHRLAMRNRGFEDGLAGRECSSDDPSYRASWRRGKERRARESS